MYMHREIYGLHEIDSIHKYAATLKHIHLFPSHLPAAAATLPTASTAMVVSVHSGLPLGIACCDPLPLAAGTRALFVSVVLECVALLGASSTARKCSVSLWSNATVLWFVSSFSLGRCDESPTEETSFFFDGGRGSAGERGDKSEIVEVDKAI